MLRIPSPTESLPLSELRKMPATDRETVLGDLIERAQASGNRQRAAIAARIRAYEERYDMSSEDLRAKLIDGRLEETREFSQWMFWFNALHNRQ
jgi:hypothetical protein